MFIPERERDKHLKEKLQTEADAVLAWAIAGWTDYRERGEKLDEPDAVLVRTKKYRADSDDVGRFIADDRWCVTSSPVLKSTTAPLHAAYQRWAAQEGGDDIGLKAFAAILDEKGFPVTQRTDKARWREGIALCSDLSDAES